VNLKELLIESAQELRDRPAFFIPKIATSIIGSIWALVMLSSIGDPFNPASHNLEALLISFAASPLILYLGLLSPVIVAEMVKNNGNIAKSTKKAVSYTPRLIKTGLLLFIAAVIVTLPLYAGILSLLLWQNIPALIIGILATLIGAVIMTYKLYFIPITLTENTALDSIKQSSKASKSHRNEVTILLSISFGLLIFSLASSGFAQNLGLIGFVLGRATSSAITTYTLIVAPKAYMEMK